MTYNVCAMETKKSFLEVLSSTQAFWLGVVATVLAIGTLGFIILGSCMLKGDCSFEQVATDTAEDTANVEVAGEPTVTGIPVVTSDDHIRGDEKAPITIIEYSDFECPYCSRFYPTMEQVMEDYDGQVRWIYRHFPLSFHPNAMTAALASECAAEQGKFWEMADALDENYADLSSEVYAKIASDLKLNTSQFADCMESEKYTDKIEAQAQAGAAAGVTGTPGSFIIDQDGNATPIKGTLPFETVASAIDSMLE